MITATSLPLPKGGTPGRTPTHPISPRPAWTVSADGVLNPTSDYVTQLNAFLFSRRTDDLLFRFVFEPFYNAAPLLVHHSRLAWAGGELYEALKREIKAGGIGEVRLRDCDDPQAFAVVREFLYALPIDLQQCSLGFLVGVGKAACHWHLDDLFAGVCDYLVQRDMLKEKRDVLAVAQLAALPAVPEPFRSYFWHRVGMCVQDVKQVKEEDQVRPFQSAPKQDPIERRLCPDFPELWQVALRQGMVRNAICSMLRYSGMGLRGVLLDVVLGYLEVRIGNDGVVCDLLNQLQLHSVDCKEVLRMHREKGKYSKRAVQLLARSFVPRTVTTQRTKQQAWQCSWPKNLQAFGSGEEFSKKVVFSPKDLEGGWMSSYEGLLRKSLSFRLSKTRSRGKDVVITLEWTTGRLFVNEHLLQDMQVNLEVVEDNCSCERKLWNHNMGQRLGRASCNEEIRKDGLLVLSVGREHVLKHRAAHVDPAACMLSISLEVIVGNR